MKGEQRQEEFPTNFAQIRLIGYSLSKWAVSLTPQERGENGPGTAFAQPGSVTGFCCEYGL